MNRRFAWRMDQAWTASRICAELAVCGRATCKLRRGMPIGWAQGFGILLDDFIAALCALLLIAMWRFV